MAHVVQGGRPPSSPKSHFAPPPHTLLLPLLPLPLSFSLRLLYCSLPMVLFGCRLILGRGSGELEADRKKKKKGGLTWSYIRAVDGSERRRPPVQITK